MSSYDAEKLKSIYGLDIENAVKHFVNYQSYLDELDKFTEESGNFLNGYTPSAVISGNDSRREFISDAEKIKDTFMRLGMVRLVSLIYNLTNAVNNNNEKVLTSGLSAFNSELTVMIKNISSARSSGEVIFYDAQKPIILAVDDKPELLSSIVGMLKNKFTVIAVTSGTAALKAIEKRTPRLFLLDIEMPQMSGYELAGMIRKQQQYAKTPIIFLTGKGTREHVAMAIKYGGNDYIIKPVTEELLVNKITKFLS